MKKNEVKSIIAEIKKSQKSLIENQKNINKNIDKLVKLLNKFVIKQWNVWFPEAKGLSCVFPEEIFGKLLGTGPFTDYDFQPGSHSDSWRCGPKKLELYYNSIPVYVLNGKWVIDSFEEGEESSKTITTDISVEVSKVKEFLEYLEKETGIKFYLNKISQKIE